MDVLARGPVQVGSLLWQPGPGRHALTVVAKVTFTLLPGESPISAEPEDIQAADAYRDNDPSRSLARASDLVPGKACPEVLLIGSAYAPGAVPVRALEVRMRVGDVDKAMLVCGDLWIAGNGTISTAKSFARMPLIWERTAGGPGTENPVGVRKGPGAPTDALGRTLAPNLEPVGASVERLQNAPWIGFGPIAPGWRPRASRLAAHATSWDFARWHLAPLPPGFDYAFWNAAPADQQLAELRGDEAIYLENLDARHPRLSTRLARVDLRAWIDWSSGVSHPLLLAPDTLTIDTDRGLLTLAFRGSTLLDHTQRALRAVVEVAGPEIAARSRPAPESRPLADPTAQEWRPASSQHPTLQLPGAAVESSPAVAAPAVAAPTPLATLDFEPAVRQTLPLPGHPASSRETMVARGAAAAPVLPFAAQARPSHLAMRAAPALEAPRPPPGARFTLYTPSTPRTAPALPFDAPTASRPAEAPRAEPWVARQEAPLLPLPSEQAAESEAKAVTPPPLVGPLATAEMAERAAEKAAASEPAPPVAAEPAAEPEAPAEPPPLPLDEITLERCAEIDASIAYRPERTNEILKRTLLDADTWSRIKAHYAGVVRDETKQRKSVLLKAYDRAYVAQLEKERGDITVDEYATMNVAAECEGAPVTLGGRPLSSDALMRIRRRWIARMATDPALCRAVRARMAKALSK